MQFTSSVFVILVALVSSNLMVKADIVAFDGSFCDGNEGSNVACNDGCNQMANRHSLLVLAPGTHCLDFFLDADCSNLVGSVENGGGGSCSNVNTGTNVQSFKCSPNSVCPQIAKGNFTAIGQAKPSGSA